MPPISSSSQKLPPQIGFLDLPYELRLKIYAEFEFPDVVEHDGAGDLTVRQTRKALMTVCRRIYDEWSPTFFRTAHTLILHRILPTGRETTSSTPNCLTVQNLAELFSKRCNDHRQRNVTTLLYHASMRHRLTRNDIPAPTDLVLQEMKSLGKCLLSHRQFSHTLLHIDLWETPNEVYLDDPFSRRRTIGWPIFSTTAARNKDEHSLVTQVWKHASKDMRWKEVVVAFESNHGTGIMEDWHIEKEVRLNVYHDPKSGYIYHTNIKRVGLRFTKTGSRTYRAEDRAAIRTTLSYSNPDGDLIGMFETPKHDYWTPAR